MALAPRTNKPLPSEADEYVVGSPPPNTRIGIALSGGGIRSAAFNLGALQALQSKGVLQAAEYLAAVSGGNYVASALTISAAYSDPKHDNGMPLWSRGSPEERYLRQHTDYLTPGRIGRIWLVLSVIYGFILNYLPFVLCGFLLGRAVGWPLHAVGVEIAQLWPNGLPLHRSLPLALLIIAAAVALTVALLVVAFRRFRDRPGGQRNYGETRSERVAAMLVATAGLIVLLLSLPILAGLYHSVSTLVITSLDSVADELAVSACWLLALLAAAATALALSRRLRARRLMMVLSSLAGAGLLLVPLLSSVDIAARRGLQSPADVLWPGVAAVLLLVMAVKVHNRRYSMHLFYRERLNSVFALFRAKKENDQVVAEPIGYSSPLYFSELGRMLAENGRRLPKLIVCCAVNLTSNEVPVGRFAESFTFEHDRTGGPLFGYLDTPQYECQKGLSGTQLTLPSIMAVSGAALSPLMGRFTYPPLRFLMALTNVRLGVWIKNPSHHSQCGTERSPNPLRRLARSIRDGWFEPGALYVLREALGGTRSDHRFIYLTDGGHWENLGLVELLRRRCTHVLCFDASAGHGLDIGRAIAIARSDLGAEVALDPTPVMPNGNGVSEDVAVLGKITYPDEQEAKLVYAKAVLAPETSWDLHAFKARDARFPNHSTSQQVFTDEQFEAYRSLGYQAGCRALAQLNIPGPVLATPEK